MILRARHIRLLICAATLLTGAGVCFAAALLIQSPTVSSPPATRPSTADAAAAPPQSTLALRRAALPGPLPVWPVRSIDGDTFEARLRIWFGQEVVTLVRLRNIDAPELQARCAVETKRAQEARATLEAILRSGEVTLVDLSLDKYAGRVVASAFVVSPDGHKDDVGTLMMAGGYARAYGGGRRPGWCA